MTDNLHVEVDRQSTREWAFPAYEEVSTNVSSINTDRGRDSERDQFVPGEATIKVQVDRQDDTFVRNYYEEPEYINGFTRANSDYLTELEGNVHVFADSDGMTMIHPPGVGMVQFDIDFASQGWEWQLGPDREYRAKVDPYKEYVLSMYVQDFQGDDTDFDFNMVVYWYTETGGFITDEWFSKINTPVDVETRVHCQATAPMRAAYCSIGMHSNGSASADFSVRFSKFMIHEYDEAYDIANGTPVKPYANQDLYDRAPEASTPIRVVSPGNQYDIANYPTETIGGGPFVREMDTLNLMAPIFSMETMTALDISGHFAANRVTKTLITTDAHDGSQCLRMQTTAGAGTIALYCSSNSVSYNIAVEPGRTYEFSFWLKNKSASPATFAFFAKDSQEVSTTLLTGQVIAGTSAWLQYSGTWTCPADNYSALIYWQFSASGYDLYLDEVKAYDVTDGLVEPQEDYNYLERFGDFEGLTNTFISSNMAQGSGVVISNMFDSSADAPKGPKFIRITKPTGTTVADFYWAKNSASSALWTEENRVYTIKFWARKVAGTTATMQAATRGNHANINTTGYTFLNQAVLTSDWVEYTWHYTAPANCSATSIAFILAGDSGEVVQADIDNIRVTRFQEEEVSTTINGLSRTATYQFEASDGHRDFYISYANDSMDNMSAMFRYYHSGKTRTRFSATLTSIGQNAPGGVTASLVWVGTNGQLIIPDSQAYQGVIAYDAAQSITLPASGSETVTGLAPDIPWRAWAPMIRLEVPSNGSYTIGYEFSDEYIGPDGYESTPEIKEDVRFAGSVRKRLDDVDTMSEDDRRLYTVGLECVDRLGRLSYASLPTPYQAVVRRDEALVHIPLNDDTLTEVGGRIQTPPVLYTRGTPSSWGAEYDSEVTLVGVDEGGSWKFTPSGSDYSGQIIEINDRSISRDGLSNELQSIGIWFSHTAAISGGDVEVLFSQLNPQDWSDGGGYAALTEDGVDVGVWAPVSFVGWPELATDGLPHYLVLAYDADEAHIYLDGSLIGTDTVIFSGFTTTYIGGEYFEGQFTKMFNGNIGQVELYDYKLNGVQVFDHWIAGKNARKGETEVERIEYVLDLANQPGIPPIVRDRDGNVPVSLSTMTSPDWDSNTAPIQILTEISKSTGGQIFAGADGAIIYENRSQRYNNGGDSNQSWHIGVGQDIEPELDNGLQVGPDMDKVINEAVIAVKNLDSDQGGIQRSSNERSIREYGRFTYRDTFDVNTPDEAKYAAQWLVATNSKPYPRYSQLVFNGHANDATAEFCKKVRISDHIHGTIALENGLDEGVISGFVESIREEIKQNGAVTTWTTYIQLSPAQNQYVWVLEDDTYGYIDDDFGLAY